MKFDKKHFDLVSNIYSFSMQESGVESNWRALLDQIAVVHNAAGAHLQVVDPLNSYFRSMANSLFPPEEVAIYDDAMVHHDRVTYLALMNREARHLFTGAELTPDRSLEEIYSSPNAIFAAKYNIIHRNVARLNNEAEWMDAFSLTHTVDHGPIAPDEKELAHLFIPHIAKAVELNRTFMLIHAQFASVLNALDELNIGVFVTEKTGQVVTKNREAERILDLNDGLKLDSRGYISTRVDDHRRILHNVINRSEDTAKGENDEAEFLLEIERFSLKEPFLLSIAPLRDDRMEFDFNYRGALVFVIDPENRAAVSTDGLQQLYKLTNAEASIAALMAQGLNNEEIADSRNVSVGTVKTQIKSLFRKTHAQSRGDLIRRALSVNIPIRK